MNVQNQTSEEQRASKEVLKQRIDAVGWGVFFILLGFLWLFPKGSIPEGSWLIGLAGIIFGVNYARKINGIERDNFIIGIGILAFLIGIGSIFGVNMPVIPILFILFGVSILFPILKNKIGYSK
jgi:hypothetical protein